MRALQQRCGTLRIREATKSGKRFLFTDKRRLLSSTSKFNDETGTVSNTFLCRINCKWQTMFMIFIPGKGRRKKELDSCEQSRFTANYYSGNSSTFQLYQLSYL